MEYSEFIAARRQQILERFYAALDAAGRPHDAARLIAVSKTVDVDEVLAAINAGYDLFAENRPQELARKVDALAQLAATTPELSRADGMPTYAFHMIGNLQTNKINQVLGRADLVHSVRSLKLAQAISKRAIARAEESEEKEAVPFYSPQPVLLEVNVSGEESKSGFAPEELRAQMEGLAALSGIQIRGLMTMAPRGSAATVRKTFEGLRLLRDELAQAYPQLNLSELSCGMSEDYEEALQEGSTMVRLGRVVFSPSFGVE